MDTTLPRSNIASSMCSYQKATYLAGSFPEKPCSCNGFATAPTATSSYKAPCACSYRGAGRHSGSRSLLAAILRCSAGSMLELSDRSLPSQDGTPLMAITRCAITGKLRSCTRSSSTSALHARRAPNWRTSGPPARVTSSRSGREQQSSGPPPSQNPAVPLRILNKHSKAERRAHQADLGPGFLRRQHIMVRTRILYTQAACRLQRWCLEHRRSMADDQIDSSLEAYFEHLYLVGETAYEARMTLYGVAWEHKMITHDINVFPCAKEALRVFVKAAPERTREQLPWAAALLISHDMILTDGFPGLHAARALVTGFDGYARPSELLKTRRPQVTTRPAGESRYPQVALRLAPSPSREDDEHARSTKTAPLDDTIVFGDPAFSSAGGGQAAKLLQRLKATTSANAMLFPLTFNESEKLFNSAFHRLELNFKACASRRTACVMAAPARTTRRACALWLTSRSAGGGRALPQCGAMRNRRDSFRSLANPALTAPSFKSSFSPPFGLTSCLDRAPLPSHPVHKVPIRDMGTRFGPVESITGSPSPHTRVFLQGILMSRPCITAHSPLEQEATSASHAVCPQKGLGSALPIHQCFSLGVFDVSVERHAVLSSMIDVMRTHRARIIQYGRSHLEPLPTKPEFYGALASGSSSR